MDDAEPLSDGEKVRIVSDFILKAPPGEFNEVFNDVRVLLNDDKLLKEGASGSFAQYSKDQFTQVKIRGQEEPAIISEFADRGDSVRFLDPRSKQLFKYDHLRKEASEFESAPVDETAEPWRSAIEQAFTEYVHQHYDGGAVSVYGRTSSGQVTIAVCIESHKFQPQNFWNGRWRSQYTLTFPAHGPTTADVHGVFKVQVHYYEDGNVQLVTSKDIKEQIKITSHDQLGKDLAKLAFDQASEYQKAIGENYQSMSQTTFKALRRQLPVTRSKLDWAKLSSYKIGNELKNN